MQHIDCIEQLFVHLVRARFAGDSFPALKDARTHKFWRQAAFGNFSCYDEFFFVSSSSLCFFLIYSSATLGFYFSRNNTSPIWTK